MLECLHPPRLSSMILPMLFDKFLRILYKDWRQAESARYRQLEENGQGLRSGHSAATGCERRTFGVQSDHTDEWYAEAAVTTSAELGVYDVLCNVTLHKRQGD